MHRALFFALASTATAVRSRASLAPCGKPSLAESSTPLEADHDSNRGLPVLEEHARWSPKLDSGDISSRVRTCVCSMVSRSFAPEPEGGCGMR